MTRRLHRLRRAGYVIIALFVVVIVGYCFGLRWFIHRQIIAALHSAGIRVVQVSVRRVTPWTLELTDLQTGEAAPDRIATIAVGYSPSTLWNRRVSEVRLSGVDVSLALGDGRFDIGPLSGIKSSGTSKGPAAPLDLPFNRIVLQSSSITVHLPAETLHVPAQGSLTRRGDGAFQVDLNLTVSLRPLHVTGTVGPTSRDIDLAATTERLDAAPVAEVASAFLSAARLTAHGSVTATARVHRSGGKSEAALTIEPSAVSLTFVPHTRSQQPTTVEDITGILQTEVSLASDTPARGAVTFRDLALTARSWNGSAQAIAGAVTFDDVAKLKTQPAQTIHVGKLTIGKMQFTDGLLVFDVAGAHSMGIHKTQWSWLGGTVSAADFHLDPSQPKVNATVQLAVVDLHELLAFFAADKASGEGKLSGRIPLVVDWPAISFGRGNLQASRGRVQIKDLKAMSAALDQTGQSGTSDVKKRVIEALSDFEYDVLRADLLSDSSGLTAGVHLSGRGHGGARTPLDTELKIHGIDDVLKLYLGYQRQKSAAGQKN